MTIEKRIEQIQVKLQSDDNIPEQTRADLMELLTSLKTEVEALSQTHQQEAAEVARSAAASAESITQETLKELRSSVEGLEASHPQLVQTVNQIALTLSNMGI